MRRMTLGKLGLLCVAAVGAVATDRPPTPFIDRGACPFECCTYRKWRALQPLKLVDRPGGKKIVGRLRAGETVDALTGETHSAPLAMEAPVDIPAARVRKGDPIFVLHFEGEMTWKIWVRGKLTDAELLGLQRVPKTEWWAKVRTLRGVVGWVRAERNFENQDACG